jgi:hypothetical protein
VIDECKEYPPSSKYGANKSLNTVDLYGNYWWYGSRPCEHSLRHFDIELDYEKGIIYDLQQDYELYRV